MDEDLEAQRQRQRSEAQAEAWGEQADVAEERRREEAKRFRAEVRDKARKWVEEHWGEDVPCPMCGSDTWGMYEPVALQPYGLPPFPNAVFPACPASCQKCGYTVFLNLIVVGILDAFPEEKE